MDRHYTPSTLAADMISCCQLRTVSNITDFAAGDGSLLRAALQRWPEAQLFAMDVDPQAVESLGQLVANGRVALDDFFRFSDDHNEIDRPQNLGDLIVLNPPFTNRGAKTYTAVVAGRIFRGSQALAFVARALNFLSPDGELIAILPSSCFSSERDEKLRDALSCEWKLDLIRTGIRYAFAGCAVTVSMVRVTRQISQSLPAEQRRHCVGPAHGPVDMLRGTIPNSAGSLQAVGVPFIHSTNLQNRRIQGITRWTTDVRKVVCGTAILIPRVGRPRVDKIALKADQSPVALSDCVIALKAPNFEGEQLLHRLIVGNWDSFEALWTGTCAPYLTMRSLAAHLRVLGFAPQAVKTLSLDRHNGRASSTAGNRDGEAQSFHLQNA